MKIEHLIESIKKRPKMFIKEERIEYIYYLLSGYCAASNKVSDDEIDQKFCCWFGKWLIMWIKENVNDEYKSETAYWYDDIKKITKKGQNEFAVFFNLYEKFYSDYTKKTGYFCWRENVEASSKI